LRVNGVDVPWSSTNLTFANNNILTVAAWNFVIPLNAEDYMELMFSTTDTEIIIFGQPPLSTPTRPGIPSLIVTVVQI
jgi:phage FluMu gp28-like protein